MEQELTQQLLRLHVQISFFVPILLFVITFLAGITGNSLSDEEDDNEDRKSVYTTALSYAIVVAFVSALVVVCVSFTSRVILW